jgi:hypothetical protein
MTETSPTLTEAEQTALDRLRAGTHVLVPVEPMKKLLTSAKMLQQNSMNCAFFHSREDFAKNGPPPWLLDTAVDIENADAMITAAQEGK